MAETNPKKIVFQFKTILALGFVRWSWLSPFFPF